LQDNVELLCRTTTTWSSGTETARPWIARATYGVTGRWGVGNVAAISLNEFQSHLAQTAGET